MTKTNVQQKQNNQITSQKQNPYLLPTSTCLKRYEYSLQLQDMPSACDHDREHVSLNPLLIRRRPCDQLNHRQNTCEPQCRTPVTSVSN